MSTTPSRVCCLDAARRGLRLHRGRPRRLPAVARLARPQSALPHRAARHAGGEPDRRVPDRRGGGLLRAPARSAPRAQAVRDHRHPRRLHHLLRVLERGGVADRGGPARLGVRDRRGAPLRLAPSHDARDNDRASLPPSDAMKRSKPLRSELGWSTPDRITVRGKDLPNEILGHLNLGDMAFLELTGRAPDPKESKLFNAMVVTLVEHGVTPSALAARLTYLGAPEALQAAVASGLLGLGSVFVGSMEGVARILYDAVEKGKDANTVLAENKRMPGIGHPIHKPVDPRSVRLFEIARETGFYGKYCKLMEAIAKEKNITLNATGAIGALPPRPPPGW